MLRNECDLLKRQVPSGRGCSVEMAQRLANASKVVDASINELNRPAEYAQNAVCHTFRNKFVPLAGRLLKISQQKVTI